MVNSIAKKRETSTRKNNGKKNKGRDIVSSKLSKKFKDSIILQNDKEITSSVGINDSKKELEKLEYLQKSEEKMKQQCMDDLAALKNKLNDKTLDSKEKFVAMRDKLKREQQIERDESYINQEMMIDSRIDEIDANKESLQEELNLHNQIEELDKRRIFKDMTESECKEKMAQLAEQREKLQDNLKNGKLDGMHEEELEEMLVELKSYEEALNNDIAIHEQKHEYEKELENPYLTKEECEQGIMQCEREIIECEQEKVNLAEEYENIPTSYDDKINKLEEGIKLYKDIEIRDKNIKEYESQKCIPKVQNAFNNFYNNKLKKIFPNIKNMMNVNNAVKIQNKEEFQRQLDGPNTNMSHKEETVGYYSPSEGVFYLQNKDGSLLPIVAKGFNSFLANNKNLEKYGLKMEKVKGRDKKILDEKIKDSLNDHFINKILGTDYHQNPDRNYRRNMLYMEELEKAFGEKTLMDAFYRNRPEELQDKFENTLASANASERNMLKNSGVSLEDASWQDFSKTFNNVNEEKNTERQLSENIKMLGYMKVLNNIIERLKKEDK